VTFSKVLQGAKATLLKVFVIRFHLSPRDLSRTRFAFSALWEVVCSYRMVQNPDKAAIHVPWLREAKPILEKLDLRPLEALVKPRSYMPDFLTPPPNTPFPSFEVELATLLSTTDEVIRKEVRKTYPEGVPAMAQPYLKEPRDTLEQLANLLQTYWEKTLEHHWPRLRLILENDVASRARNLALGGAEALFADLNTMVHYQSERLEVIGGCGSDYDVQAKNSKTQKNILEIRKHAKQVFNVDPKGRGLLLVPSVFVWPKVMTMIDPPYQPTLVYSPRGAANAWLTEAASNDALELLLGSTSAQILLSLTAPATTLELSRNLKLAAGGVSHHLSKLSEAGLVTAQRQGREVYYHLTNTGEQLLHLFEKQEAFADVA
jgi:DNA-binding transcriptional ArsR family regulator